MSRERTPVLLIGGSDMGKTHFATVLVEKWTRGIGELQLESRPEDLKIFDEARQRISNGLVAKHTAAATAAEVAFQLRAKDGQSVELVLPEYGGEKLSEIARMRRVNPWWLERLRASPAWLLLLRLSRIRRHQDILDRLRRVPEKGAVEKPAPSAWDGGAYWTELMQILLDGAGCSILEPLKRPRLAVVLSCWDELGEEEQKRPPTELLQREAPLLFEFLSANWSPAALSVWGLSSLGRALGDKEPNEDYVDLGPAAQGYVVDPQGRQERALDMPLVWLLGTS
jgi:hypothetical protein